MIEIKVQEWLPFFIYVIFFFYIVSTNIIYCLVLKMLKQYTVVFNKTKTKLLLHLNIVYI